MAHLRRAFGVLTILAVLLGTESVAAQAPAPTNAICPVTGDDILVELSAVYKGRTVYFCCEHCLNEFESDPEKYLAGLPQFAPGSPEPPPALQQAAIASEEAEETTFEAVSRTLGDLWYLWVFGLILVTLRPHVARRSHKAPESVWAMVSRPWVTLVVFGNFAFVSTASAYSDAATAIAIDYWWVLMVGAVTISMRTGLLTSVIIVQGAVIVAMFMGRADTATHHEAVTQKLTDRIARDELRDRLHYATYHDFGDPPRPPHPSWGAQLDDTYYRGNDERSDRLFNGGNYRTATFYVSLRTKDDVAVKHGDDVTGKELFVRLEIGRAPNTPDFFYSPEMMNTIFVTRNSEPFLGESGPADDRMQLTTVEPMQRWEARVSIGVAGAEPLDGLIYVRQDQEEDGKIVGARFHYGLMYAMKFDQGVVADTSDLWMGTLYRTRKVALWKLPYKEWFSDAPIPVLPKPHVTDDPTLLGMDDYTSP